MTTVTPSQLVADLAAWATYARDRTHQVVVQYGAVLQGNVKRHAAMPRTNPRPASSPEGPRLLTGGYNRSINRQSTRSGTVSRTQVGTDDVRAARLELGFHGTDSLGRNYTQQPYPHFGPGLDETVPGFEAAIDAVLAPPGTANPTTSIHGLTVNQ